MVGYLEYLSEEGLISYTFNQTMITDQGTFKSCSVMVTDKCLNGVVALVC